MEKKAAEIVTLDYLRINRDIQKECKCFDTVYEIDLANRRTRCNQCGAIVEAFDAMLKMAENTEVLNEIHQRRIAQKERIEKETEVLLNQKAELEQEIAELQKKRNGLLLKQKR